MPYPYFTYVVKGMPLSITSNADPLLFLPARRYASAGNCDRNVSVRLSVTRRYCVKTKKASGKIFTPSGSPKILVF